MASWYDESVNNQIPCDNIWPSLNPCPILEPYILLNFVLLLLQEVATMQFRASGLDKKDLFGKSDPFLIFYRANQDGRLVRYLD